MELRENFTNELNKPMNTFGTQVKSDNLYEKIPLCKVLGQKAVPNFGIYGKENAKLMKNLIGYDYQWIYPTASFKCDV